MMEKPSCFGLVYDDKAPECNSCLLNEKCLHELLLQDESKAFVQDGELPNDRKKLAWMICKRFNIPTEVLTPSGVVKVTKENFDQFADLSFLLTNLASLKILCLAYPRED